MRTRLETVVLALVASAATAGCLAEALDSVPTRTPAPVAPPAASPAPAPEPEPATFSPGPPRFRRLVASQYVNAIEDLLGPEAAEAAAPPPDPTLNGLKGIAASELALASTELAQYERSARAAVEAGERASPLGPRFAICDDSAPDCRAQRVARAVERAFRRPPTVDEIVRYQRLARTVADRESDASAGLGAVMQALLQSPAFLYRVEVGRPDPGHAGRRRLGDYELAGRLAFFLTDRPPDGRLLALAAEGRLQDRSVIAEEADRLLAGEHARAALAAFYDEYLRLGELPSLVKNPYVFPMADPPLLADMRRQTQLLIADVVWDRDVDFRRVFDSRRTHLNRRLAVLYGLEDLLPAGAPAGEWVPVDLPAPSLRAGYLGQSSFLALNSHPLSTSPTLRGKFVQEVLFCRAIPAPPPNVNTAFPEPEPGQGPMTTRQRVEQHLSNEACAGCHAHMDPIGLGLENFDALGRFRETENGLPIDASSEFAGVPFTGAAALGDILASSERAAFCVIRNLFRHATGHVETPSEAPSLEAVDRIFAASGYRLKAALRALVISDAFLFVSES